MKRLAVLLLFAAPAFAAPVKSHDIYVNGKFLISSYIVDATQVVALDDVRKVVGGHIAVNGGRVMSSPPNEMRPTHGLFIKKSAVLGNLVTLGGRQWISTANFVQQLGGSNAVSAFNRLSPGAALQIALFDCPDVRCCPDCGIAMH